ncbi:MAG: hypothetical protein ACTSYL_01905 [Candidatus Thorarchaeota archaeon]
MDTAKDARVRIVEDALARLTAIIRNRRLKMHLDYGKFNEVLKTLEGLFYEIKYSYVEAPQLAELPATKKIVQAIAAMGEGFEATITSTGHKPKTDSERLAIAEFRYAIRTITGFPRRLVKYPDDAGYAVDLLAVEISQTSAVAGSNKLTECRCTDGSRIWTIVTNIQGVKKETKLAAAVLPPTEFMGVISEAMFLGGDSLSDETPLGLLENIPERSLAQARGQVFSLIKRLA